LYRRKKKKTVKSGRMIWTRHVACMGEMRNAYIVFAVKPQKKIDLWFI
jgi:hypothetical protein